MPYYQTPYMAAFSPNIQQPQQIQPAPNVLPQQQVVQVNGKASVDAIRMSPNSSILLMDSTAPMVWLCVSDGLGNVTSTPYDIAVHQDLPPVDMSELEARVANIENIVAKMGEKNNGKSNDANAKRSGQQSVRTDKAN